MIKTIKNNKKTSIKNKTYKNKKNKVTSLQKREFIIAILKEWKKQSGGCHVKDTHTIYKGDYYLSLNKICDFYNHIHLILKNLNTHYYKYVMKKMDKDSNIIHSKEVKIDVLSDPKKVVRSMIKNNKDFIKL